MTAVVCRSFLQMRITARLCACSDCSPCRIVACCSMTSHGRRGLGKGPGDVISRLVSGEIVLPLRRTKRRSLSLGVYPFCQWRLYLALLLSLFLQVVQVIVSINAQLSKHAANTESQKPNKRASRQQSSANRQVVSLCLRVSPSLGLNRVTTPTVAREHKSGGKMFAGGRRRA